EACDDSHPCNKTLACSGNKCLIPYGSTVWDCESGFDCVIGVVCTYHGGDKVGRCTQDHRCQRGACTNPATECDEDEVCGYKEGETCYGPCRKGLTCRLGRCRP
uniref:Turripeptide OL55-like n=1 Tax=Lophiotoma albina TaxID=3245477 RepID=TU55_LOPAL|nr:RecName: Full=Turripeptide OL55-like [Xenuroturris albina]